MITAIVLVAAVTREMSLSPFGITRTTFHVDAGTNTRPFATVVVTPPLLPVPPAPVGPETMYSSLAGRSVRRKFSKSAHGPWLLSGACATMFDIRNVAWLIGIDVSLSRSAFGVM